MRRVCAGAKSLTAERECMSAILYLARTRSRARLNPFPSTVLPRAQTTPLGRWLPRAKDSIYTAVAESASVPPGFSGCIPLCVDRASEGIGEIDWVVVSDRRG